MPSSKRLLLVAAGLAAASACAASSPNAGPVASASGVPTAPPPPPPTVALSASASATAVASADPPPPPPPAACPADMILVDGDYCSEVKQECIKKWYDKSNKKEICEEFKPPTVCAGTKSKKRYCIDKYSWPNVKGERPEVMNNFYQAQVKCASRGRRMCTESEWTFACEGPSMKPFPYGWVRDTKKCNGDLPWDSPNMKKVGKRDATELGRLYHGVRNGEQPGCVSDFGVPDLPGNADDLASSETKGKSAKSDFDNVTIGGPWYKGVRNQCRPRIYTHNEGFYYYYLSFRCCGEADQKASDPRAPKQIARGWTFERVEKLAGFTKDEVKDKLEQKAKGQCSCKDSDILCKTICGTLLGPNAVDVKLTP